jgi:hypothetical protein
VNADQALAAQDHRVLAAQAVSERNETRFEAALQAGWVIRRDPVRLEFTAAREVHVARTIDELLDAIEASGD